MKKVNTKIRARIAILLFSLFVFAGDIDAKEIEKTGEPVRIGYFHGGRTMLLYRAYEMKEFKKRGVDVQLHSKDLYDDSYKILPPSIYKFNKGGFKRIIGKVTGVRLIEDLLKDKFDVATVGEGSFIQSIHMGADIVAFAELGHDVKGHSGHVMAIKHEIQVNGKEDYFGKMLVVRRAGPMDLIFMLEFLEQQGIDLDEDILYIDELPESIEEKALLPRDKVLIANDINEDMLDEVIENGVADGGYFHLLHFKKIDETFKIIEPLHRWSNPELSQALLVCSREYYEKNKDKLVPLLEAYISRTLYEHSLDQTERLRRDWRIFSEQASSKVSLSDHGLEDWEKATIAYTRGGKKGSYLALNYNGLNIPQYDLKPYVDGSLLKEIERLLIKHRVIDDKKKIMNDYIKNDLVDKALKNLKIDKIKDYKPPKF